jgi:hypothetical protein
MRCGPCECGVTGARQRPDTVAQCGAVGVFRQSQRDERSGSAATGAATLPTEPPPLSRPVRCRNQLRATVRHSIVDHYFLFKLPGSVYFNLIMIG